MNSILRVFVLVELVFCDFAPHPDVGLNITQLVEKYGYTIEEHPDIETDDGYLLTLHRIPCGKVCNSTEKQKPAVLLVHGLMASAENWLLKSEKSISFQLADEGYDVWLGNTRGSKHSRKHKTLNPDTDVAFWKYSFNEIGYYDLPVKIDYILNQTKLPNLVYVGHSQGTTSCFVLLSERPEYNAKIKLMTALAPIAFMGHVNQPVLKYLSRFHLEVQEMIKNMNYYEIFPFRKEMWQMGASLCAQNSSSAVMCYSAMFLFVGDDWDDNDMSMISLIASHYPDDVSARQLLHYLQCIHSGKFRKYDFGPSKNLKRYRSILPPKYKLAKITAPIAMIYGQNDLLASLIDVNMLKRRLSNVVYDYMIPYNKFNHFDFLVAKNVTELVYNPMIHLINKFR